MTMIIDNKADMTQLSMQYIVVMVLADLDECLHIFLGECSLHIEIIVRVKNCRLHLHQWTCVVREECTCECVCVGGGGVCMCFTISRHVSLVYKY